MLSPHSRDQNKTSNKNQKLSKKINIEKHINDILIIEFDKTVKIFKKLEKIHANL